LTAHGARQRFVGQLVIVTGAGSGIGFSAATAFASEGATVYGIDIDEPGLERALRSVAGSSGAFIPVVADVAQPGEITAGVQNILLRAGRLDILVNNAGINMAKRISDLSLEDWNRVFDTNLRGMYLCCKAAWPGFVAQRHGVIVNIASVMGQVGGVGSPAYCSTKAGIIMLTRCLAKDGAGSGIRVNSVCPGYIDTPIMEKVLRETPDPVRARQDIVDRMPLGRMGSPQDVAAGILFLASADAAYISGTELTIDGAVTATQID
jgi:NAD(P)-dependent dehydrogenase (short-subunit alcohol dehydrogenase family)